MPVVVHPLCRSPLPWKTMNGGGQGHGIPRPIKRWIDELHLNLVKLNSAKKNKHHRD